MTRDDRTNELIDIDVDVVPNSIDIGPLRVGDPAPAMPATTDPWDRTPEELIEVFHAFSEAYPAQGVKDTEAWATTLDADVREIIESPFVSISQDHAAWPMPVADPRKYPDDMTMWGISIQLDRDVKVNGTTLHKAPALYQVRAATAAWVPPNLTWEPLIHVLRIDRTPYTETDGVTGATTTYERTALGSSPVLPDDVEGRPFTSLVGEGTPYENYAELYDAVGITPHDLAETLRAMKPKAARAIMPTGKMLTSTTTGMDLLQTILVNEPKSGEIALGKYEGEQVEEHRAVTGDVIVTTLHNPKSHNGNETIELITPDLRNPNGNRIRGDKRRRAAKLYEYVMDQLSSTANTKERRYRPVFISTTDLVAAGIYADQHAAWQAMQDVLPGLTSVIVRGHWGGPYGPSYDTGRQQMFHVRVTRAKDPGEKKQGAYVSVACDPGEERTVFEFLNRNWGTLGGDIYQMGDVATHIFRKAIHKLRTGANDTKNLSRISVRMDYSELLEAGGLRDVHTKRPDKAHAKIVDALAEIDAHEKDQAKKCKHSPWLTLRRSHMTTVRDAQDAGHVIFYFTGDYLEDNVTTPRLAQEQKKKAARKKADQPTTRRRRKKTPKDDGGKPGDAKK